MSIRVDDRGQALQVGAVLLFGLLIVLFSFWQAFVVPDQNRRVEFTHNQEVQQQMTQLRSTVISMPGETTPRSVTVNLGTTYPTRLLFSNPRAPTGTLQTNNTLNPTVNLEIRNAIADANKSTGARAFWDGSGKEFNTGALEYQPDYSVLQTAGRTVYSNTVVYNQFPLENESTTTVTGQALVDGTDLNVITLAGDYDQTRVGRVAVDIEPVSTQSRSVTVERVGPDQPITLELPSRLGDDAWQQLLENEPARVVDNDDNSTVRIVLTREEYSLRMTRVRVGAGATTPDPAYVAGVSGPGIDSQAPIPTDENRTITLEVRDTYNAPVSGATLTGSSNNSGVAVRPVEDSQTNENGQVTFEIDPTDLNAASVNDSQPVSLTFEAPNVAGIDESFGTNITLDPSLSQTPPFDVSWAVQSINNSSNNFDCDVANDTCSISASQDGEMIVSVSGASSGELRFAVEDGGAGTFRNVSATFEGTTGRVTFQAADNIPLNGNESTTVYVFGGGDRDSMTVNVTNDVPDSLVHLYDATRDADSNLNQGIEKIPDIEPNNPVDLTAPTDGAELVPNGINGKRSYDFENRDEFFRYDSEVSNPWTIVGVVKVPTTGFPQTFYDNGGGGLSGGAGGLVLQTGSGGAGTGKQTLATGAGPGKSNQIDIGEDLSTDPAAIIRAENPASGKSTFNISTRKGGSKPNTKNTATNSFGGSGPVFFFDQFSTSGSDFERYVGEIAIFNSAVNSEIKEYQERLKDKWFK